MKDVNRWSIVALKELEELRATARFKQRRMSRALLPSARRRAA
jgi:hypothetical protein